MFKAAGLPDVIRGFNAVPDVDELEKGLRALPELDETTREAILGAARLEQARITQLAERKAKIDAQIEEVVDDMRRIGYRVNGDFFGLGSAAEAVYHLARIAFLEAKKAQLTLEAFFEVLERRKLIETLSITPAQREIVKEAYGLAVKTLNAESDAHRYVAAHISDPNKASSARQAISAAAENERIIGLDDWVAFSAKSPINPSEATVANFLDDVDELRAAQTMVGELGPGEIIRVGNDARAGNYLNSDGNLPSFDGVVEGGLVQRNIEVYSSSGTLNKESFRKMFNHVHDKIVAKAENVDPKDETKGLVEGVIVADWPPAAVKYDGGGEIQTARNGDRILTTDNSSPRVIDNFFDNYVRLLNGEVRGAPPAGAEFVDRVTALDRNGNMVYIFRRDATTGKWSGEYREPGSAGAGAGAETP